MKLVLKIGGSLLFDRRKRLYTTRFEQFAQVIGKIATQGHKLVVVVGGGALAKSLINRGVRLNAGRDALDRLGIASTWVCAQLMIAALGDRAYPTPMFSEEQVLEHLAGTRLLVVGGLQPGQSTNAVAARIAELTESEVVVNATDVDGVYDQDPDRFPQAKRFESITVSQLRQIISSLSDKPGEYPLFDKNALNIVQRSGIEVWFVNGTNPDNILDAVSHQHIGTRLVSG
ncbi:MAG: UMP kinase [Promethearchaeota archaeon]